MNRAKSSMRLLRWAGSKSQSANAITPYLDFSKQYVEAFCGSASFFFANSPREACLNDTNRDLIQFYRDIAVEPERVWSCYNEIPVGRENYNEARARFNGDIKGVERSSHFLYLNHYCFNGIYRTNKAGKFNTPFGKHGNSKSKMPLDVLKNYASHLKQVEFSCLDFEEFLLKSNFRDCCIYLDPPYFTDDARVFREYGATPFRGSDLERLKHVFDWLRRKNQVVVTYKDCAEFRERFENLIVTEIPITRNIGGFAGRRKRDKELVAAAGMS